MQLCHICQTPFTTTERTIHDKGATDIVFLCAKCYNRLVRAEQRELLKKSLRVLPGKPSS